MTSETAIASLSLLVLLSCPAFAQSGASAAPPNGAPLKTMQDARSYALVNRSKDFVTAVHIRMTNGDERDMTWHTPVAPQEGRDIAVPIKDCLKSVVVTFKSGRTLRTSEASDCRMTRIIVQNDAIEVGTTASNEPPHS